MKKLYALTACCFALFTGTAIAQPGSVTLTAPGGTLTTYPSIKSAYAAIPNAPSGDYLIEINATYLGTDASETYPITFGSKNIAVNGPKITIRPAAANVSCIIKRPTPAAGVVVMLSGCSNIVLDGRPGGVTSNVNNYMIVVDDFVGSNTNRNIEIANDASNNIVQYVTALAAPATAAGAGSRVILIGSGITTGNNNNIIQNCTVDQGLRSIQDFGLSATVVNNANKIMNNVVSRAGAIGIFAGSNQKNITISGNTITTISAPPGTTFTAIQQQTTDAGNAGFITNNTIDLTIPASATLTDLRAIVNLGSGTELMSGNHIFINMNTTGVSPFAMGIYCGAATGGLPGNFIITKNHIHSMQSTTTGIQFYGMYMAPVDGSTVNIHNNFVALPDANATAGLVAGMFFGGSGTSTRSYTSNVYFNSIHIGGTNTTATGINAVGIYRINDGASSVYNQKNNLVLVTRQGTANNYMIGYYNGSTAGTVNVDYNNYYATDAVAGWGAGYDGTVFRPTAAGLTAYQTEVVPQEANTKFSAFTYLSGNDLHLSAASAGDVNLLGTPITGINADFDGDARNATTPTMGADEGTAAMPVELMVFEGERKEGRNLLRWTTASEANNIGFDLQRSADGKLYTTLAFVATKAENGSSTTMLNYNFTDDKAPAGNNYYRLVQKDKDGKTTISKEILIKGEIIKTFDVVNLYPNPASNMIRVKLHAVNSGNAQLFVTDMMAKTMMQQTLAVTSGENNFEVQISSLPAGVYILKLVAADGTSISRKLIKQ